MLTVLVVEDEPLIRLTLIDALEDAGFKVIEAETADEAMDLISEHTVHLLFTDIQMPGQKSGVDLANEVATRFPEAGIIVASGRIRSHEIALPPTAQFLSKPYDLDSIVERFKDLSKIEN